MTDVDTGSEPDENDGHAPTDGGDDQGSNEPVDVEAENRRLRGENRAMRRERNSLRDRAKQLEDQGKTEEQRLRDSEAAARAEAATERAKAQKFEVAAEVGLPLSLAKRIQGGNREEMVEDAKTLLGSIGTGASDNGGHTDFHGGVRGPAVGRPKTMNDLIRQAAGRR